MIETNWIELIELGYGPMFLIAIAAVTRYLKGMIEARVNAMQVHITDLKDAISDERLEWHKAVDRMEKYLAACHDERMELQRKLVESRNK